MSVIDYSVEILAPNDRDYLKNDTHDDGDKARSSYTIGTRNYERIKDYI